MSNNLKNGFSVTDSKIEKTALVVVSDSGGELPEYEGRLLKGDTIIEYDGEFVFGSLDSLIKLSQNALDRDTVSVLVERGGKYIELLVKPGPLGVKVEERTVSSKTAFKYPTTGHIHDQSVRIIEDSVRKRPVTSQVIDVTNEDHALSLSEIEYGEEEISNRQVAVSLVVATILIIFSLLIVNV